MYLHCLCKPLLVLRLRKIFAPQTATSISAAAHIQLQRCKGDSLVSFGYLFSRFVFFSFCPLISFSHFHDFTSLASSVASITPSSLLLNMFLFFFCSFIFWGNSSSPALLDSLTHDYVLSALQLGSSSLHNFDCLILSLILCIFVASPESLGFKLSSSGTG